MPQINFSASFPGSVLNQKKLNPKEISFHLTYAMIHLTFAPGHNQFAVNLVYLFRNLFKNILFGKPLNSR